MKKIKVLHIINGMGSGGAEMLIMNWLRNIDTSKFQFDFLLRSNDCMYEDEIVSKGGHIYYTASFPKHWLTNKKETIKFFRNHKYDVVHVHGNALIYMEGLKQAKRSQTPLIIMHSHNTKTYIPAFTIIHLFNRVKIKRYANCFLSCGEAAGKWMFGDNKFTVVNNGVDENTFKYDSIKRKQIRDKLNIKENEFVIGHVGRFLPVKNHKFILRVFKEILKKGSNAKLLLIGEGPEYDNIQNYAKELNISKSVRFLGLRQDISDLEQAMDLFLFPSLHEGLPFVLIEAQMIGLPCLVSSTISTESSISNNIKFYSLDQDANKWADQALRMREEFSRDENYLTERAAAYSSKDSARKISEIYINGVSK